jgi:hypothetical protein
MRVAVREDYGFKQPLIGDSNYIQQKMPMSRQKRFISVGICKYIVQERPRLDVLWRGYRLFFYIW